MMYITNGKGSLVHGAAGIFILIGVTLGYVVHPGFFLFAGFVGFMLAQSSLTGFCPMYWILKKLGIGESAGAKDSAVASGCRC